MSQQTFTVSERPRITITRVKGDLNVQPWDQREVSVEIDGHVGGIQQEGDALMISDCSSDMELMMPPDASIKVSTVGGDVEIRGVRRVELENVGGDVELQNISGDASAENIGEAVDLTSISGDLVVKNALALRVRRRVGGDAELAQIGQIEMEAISGDCEVESAGTVMIAAVGGDLAVQDVSTVLRCGVVSGDCEVQGSTAAQVTLGNVGGSLEIGGAASVQAGNVRGDCEVSDVMTDIEIGNISGTLECSGAGGNLRVGRVAGDAELSGVSGGVEINTIGGDLELQASFPSDSHTRMKVGGDATITLPDNPNLRISAMVGGDVSGVGIVATSSGNVINLVYGDGNAYLDLKVGGDLDLHSFDQPRSSSSMGGGSWNDFGREMAEFGREMGRMGQELSREISEGLKNAGWSAGSDVAEDIRRRTEEGVRRAREHAEADARRARERAEEHARREQQRPPRVNVRFNDREWRMDPERLNRILEQAKQAADEGVYGALEAVERALRNIRIPKPPNPPSAPNRPSQPNQPTPPAPPPGPEGSVNPVSPVDPVQPVSPVSPVSPVTSPFASQEQGEGRNASPEQEREAILRMIAEGRITPEEGDLLLEALGE